MHEESRPLTPLVCFLSMGSDPTPYIEMLAKRLELKSKSISMGQGQEVHARKMLTGAMQDVGSLFCVNLFGIFSYGFVALGLLGFATELSFVIGLHERSFVDILGFRKRDRYNTSRFPIVDNNRSAPKIPDQFIAALH